MIAGTVAVVGRAMTDVIPVSLTPDAPGRQHPNRDRPMVYIAVHHATERGKRRVNALLYGDAYGTVGGYRAVPEHGNGKRRQAGAVEYVTLPDRFRLSWQDSSVGAG